MRRRRVDTARGQGNRARSTTPWLGGYSRNPGDFRPRQLPSLLFTTGTGENPPLALSSFLAENHCVLPPPCDLSSSQRRQVLASFPQQSPQTREFRHTTADTQRRWWLCRHSGTHRYTTQGPGGVDGASPWRRHCAFARRSSGSRGEFTPDAALRPRVGELKARDN